MKHHQIRVLSANGNRQVDTVTMTQEEMEQRGLNPNSVLYAVPVGKKDGKEEFIYLQKDCRMIGTIL